MERFRVLVVVAILGTVLGGCAGQGPPSLEPRDVAATTRAPREEAPPEECEGGPIVDHAFSVSDDTNLVGFADNVFVGRVKERIGSVRVTPARPYGSTRFSVKVLENVKGGLGGSVTVGQEGSFDAERRCLRLAEDDPLLRSGQEVMFFTRHDEKHGWHQIFAPGYGDVRIEGERQREELVRRFERARRNQTDPTPGRH